ncbi:APC family permease [Actinacidiphila soli]|uniref:APC family permease n=1 Tax=Actinacidiphila soli TaxID=2487275 RepID=UPI0013E3E45E|nr:APC family permease [Actinacidiphila soli]
MSVPPEPTVSERATPGAAAVPSPPETRLAGGSLNLRRVAFIGLAYFALAPVIYLNMGFIESAAGGPVMPLVFLLITIAIIPTAISFAVMNGRRPSAGSAFTWLWESTRPGVGLWVGWMMITGYVISAALYPLAFAVFFNAFLQYFGVHTSLWTGYGGGLLSIAVATYMARSNIRLGARMIGVLMLFEAAFVAIVAVVIVARGGSLGHFSAAPFNPGAAKAGFSGLGLALVFAFMSIAGVDSIAPVAEESKTPSRMIPLATILITVIAGLFWTLTSYGFAISVPVHTVEAYVSAGQVTPVYPIAQKYVGALAILVPITGFTAAIASFGASIYAASRLLYAVAREGFGPARLAKVDSKTHGPWNAELATILIAAVSLIFFAWWQDGPSNGYGYLGVIFVFFVLVCYLGVNVANLVYHLRYKRPEFRWFVNGAVPVLGIIIDGYILYQGFFVAELGLPFKTGGSIVLFSLLWAVVGIGWAVRWARKRDLRSVSLTTLETDAG